MTRVFTEDGASVPVTVHRGRAEPGDPGQDVEQRRLSCPAGDRRQAPRHARDQGRWPGSSPRRAPRPGAACGSSAWPTAKARHRRRAAQINGRQFEAGQKVDVAGTTVGKGFAGVRSSATTSPEAGRHPRQLAVASRAGLHRPAPDAGPGVQGQAHGRPHGRRAAHRAEPGSGAGRPGAQPAAGQGRGAGRAGRRRDHCPAVKARRSKGGEHDGYAESQGGAQRSGFRQRLRRSDFNEALVHQVVTAYMAGGRAGTKAQKTRAAVRGGGSKPCKQKGTGRARAGTIRSPMWRRRRQGVRGGAARLRQKVNRKMYRAAMRSILSELVRQDRLVVVSDFEVDSPKTQGLVDKLHGRARRRNDVLMLVDGLRREPVSGGAQPARRRSARHGEIVDPVEPGALRQDAR